MSAFPAGLRARVRGFAIDHRKVQPGFVFGAFQGARFDGESVIAEAVAAGAIAVVARPQAAVVGALHLADAQPRRLFAQLAGEMLGPYPPTTVAVTGTNGKTSTVDLVRQLWLGQGQRAASMGTLGVITGAGAKAGATGGLTTPDILTFLQTAAQLRADGTTHLAYEASSHGLAQYRCEGLPVQAAAFTNLTRDHLDYHHDMEAYFAAKARLFAEVAAADATAVVWLDAAADGAQFNRRMAALARARGLRLWTVGPDGTDIRIVAQTPTAHGQNLQLALFGASAEIELPLIGGYQAANALLAAALVLATGGDVAATLAGLAQVQGVPGRLQRAALTPTGAPVYVDYAHTPDALHAVLMALRPHAAGRLLVLFGCGGDRDHGKRPQMGRVAHDLADVVVVTDDNPRSEDPAMIRKAILAAAPGAREIAGRREAIAAIIGAAHAGDIVLLAGKGHEQGQIVGAEVLPFDDVQVAREICGRRA